MTRHYASHQRRIRINIDPNVDVPKKAEPKPAPVKVLAKDDPLIFDDDELFADLEDGASREPYPHEVFQALPLKGDGVEYRKPRSQRNKGDFESLTRDVKVKKDGAEVFGWLTWNSTYGLTITVGSPTPEVLVDRVCEDVRKVYEEKGFKAKPKIKSLEVQKEEICTWIPNRHREKVLEGLPLLIRYAETIDWRIEQDTEEGWVVISGLALSFPRLYPTGKTTFKKHVVLDVKFYKTGSKNQPLKLEFQIQMPGKKRGGGNFVPERVWKEAVRATGLKLMDAFLEFCGVDETTLSSGQSGKIVALERLPYEPAILDDLRNLASRPAKAIAPFFVQDVKRKLGLDDESKKDLAVVELLRSFKHVECRWGEFYEGFPGLVDGLTQLHENGAKDEEKETLIDGVVRDLKPTRDNLFYTLSNGTRITTTSSRFREAISKRLVRQYGTVEERRFSNKKGLLRFTNQAF